jgi:hypothetical protein
VASRFCFPFEISLLWFLTSLRHGSRDRGGVQVMGASLVRRFSRCLLPDQTKCLAGLDELRAKTNQTATLLRIMNDGTVLG